MPETISNIFAFIFFILTCSAFMIVFSIICDPVNMRSITSWFLDWFSAKFPAQPTQNKSSFEIWTQTRNILERAYQEQLTDEDLERAAEILTQIERHQLVMPPVPWYYRIKKIQQIPSEDNKRIL